MGFLLKLVLSSIWLVFIPLFAGPVFLRKKTSFCIAESLLTGYIFLFSLAEVMILLFLYLQMPLHMLSISYAAVTGITALAGFVFIIKKAYPSGQFERFSFKKTSLFFWAAIIFILVQMAVVFYFAHLDADDAFYVGAATTALESDSIFGLNAYTGVPYIHLPKRYVYSPFPILLAVFCQLSGSLHPSVMAHTILPVVFLMVTYMVMHLLSKKLLPDNRDGQGIFLFLTAVLSWFSAYSIYNAGDFQMIRIWQGKASLAAYMFPFLIYLCISILMEETSDYPWFFLLMSELGCCLLSSMGIILAPIIIGVFAFMSLIRFKSLKRPLIALCCCIPSALLGAAYLFLQL